jgi:hypothetical protein
MTNWPVAFTVPPVTLLSGIFSTGIGSPVTIDSSTGIAISLGTPWGLFRHYWVVLKLLITAFSTVILMIYMGTFRQMAGMAADPVVELGLVRNPSPVVHAILALILLVIATVLGVYKPFGMTAYARRTQLEPRQALSPAASRPQSGSTDTISTSPWVYVAGVVVIAALLFFVILHLLGGSVLHH